MICRTCPHAVSISWDRLCEQLVAVDFPYDGEPKLILRGRAYWGDKPYWATHHTNIVKLEDLFSGFSLIDLGRPQICGDYWHLRITMDRIGFDLPDGQDGLAYCNQMTTRKDIPWNADPAPFELEHWQVVTTV